MKKIAFTLFLAFIFVFSLSINAVADDGNIGHGRTDCGAANQPPCPVAEPIETAEDTTIFKTVIDYLAQLFG
ncbi:MAG TPA: hypothetical protein VF721_19215 [Pyrinomonadaceae bacterium]|jgi:hypothetical protein